MSFKVTVYFNDEFIDSTQIDTPDGNTYTGYYGDSAYSTSAPLYTAVIIKANPANGCVFSHWVYRYVVDGVQSDPMYDYGEEYNPFPYDGSDGDLIIRAVGVDSGDEETSVEKWNWFVSNGSATELQTVNSFGALRRKEPTINFSYKVWNDMVDKVWEILSVLDGEWDNTYATYEDTRMTSDDTTLTAKRFNSLRYNIGSRYSTGIDEVNPGDPVLGSYFATLTNCINGWIDKL